ncbi:AAA family ATPase [Hyphococcus flavus]|uniref:AAA family ATPase n=1 Tax=Hyphococcus flavus TaxID=1866326 RepID=A0AAE9ZDB0_9PROT|nr:AAA family ATPase [Hyphococcus flavus]WDI32629.1 AAA family ATPase [Hyphococcus flavus]
MKIKTLQLKNGYKRFHDLTIDLGDNPARIVALLGPNGSGKSSVFDGMLFLQNNHNQIGGEGHRPNKYHSMHGETNFQSSNVSIEFDQGQYNEVYAAKNKSGQAGTIFSFRSSYRYNSQLNVTQIKSIEDISTNNYGAGSASAIDQKMDVNYRRLFAYYNNYLEEKDCRPSEAKKAIVSELNDSLEKCLDIKIDNLGNIEDNKGSLFFTKYDQATPYEFDVLSSGEKEVVDILLDLFLRKERYSDTIYIIDEPELHINTSIQKLLLLEIEKLIGDQCQIWVATHSVGLMRALQSDLKDKCQIIYFEPGRNYGTESITLYPIEKNYRTWREIFRTALDDLTELVSPKRIIYCEGRDKPGSSGIERGFDAKIYNEIFGKAHPDTLFVSSGGNTELDQRSNIAMMVLSKALPTLEILVLKDRDIMPDRATTITDRTTYLENNPQNHRMLKRKEIENYLFDKSVIVSFCAARGLSFDEASFDKLVSDISDEDVKSLASEIKNCCGLASNYGTQQFKSELAQHITPETPTYTELHSVIFN